MEAYRLTNTAARLISTYQAGLVTLQRVSMALFVRLQGAEGSMLRRRERDVPRNIGLSMWSVVEKAWHKFTALRAA